MKITRISVCACVLSAGMLLASCRNEKTSEEETVQATTTDDEKFRPAFHFTPSSNWMNDPNGMFFLNGTYHLYFQYYPEDNVWGPMHWGHATSKDMITWEEQPIALEPDELGYIFSGSAVVDHNNTSGFGDGKTPPVIAIFTYHDPEGEKEGREDYQSQAIAYSLDEGMTWKKYEGNPVIPNPGIKDFRDPKVTWDDQNKQWLMALATVDKTLFYGSPNLKEWKLLFDFGEGTGAHDGVWECPDFFPMKVKETGETKWVLIQSLNPGGYNGGSGTQYFVGDFNGKTFTVDPSMKNLPEKHNYWIDYGKDNYAGVTWSNIPEEDGRTLFIGWMSNWLYAQEVPTTTWRSAMTIARSLDLVKDEDSYRLLSQPVKELENYVAATTSIGTIRVTKSSSLVSPNDADLSQAIINFEIEMDKEKSYEFQLYNPSGESLLFGYKVDENEFYINRENSGLIDFSENFSNKVSTAPRTSNADILKVTMVLDRTSIEIFYDDGETVMTEIFFPNRPFTTLASTGTDSFTIGNLEVKELNFPKTEKR